MFHCMRLKSHPRMFSMSVEPCLILGGMASCKLYLLIIAAYHVLHREPQCWDPRS